MTPPYNEMAPRNGTSSKKTNRPTQEGYYEDLGTTFVRMDRNLNQQLRHVYAGTGKNDLKTVSDIVWHLVTRDVDIATVEHDHPEVKEWLLKAAEDRNAAYARRVTREIRAKGGKIARVELE